MESVGLVLVCFLKDCIVFLVLLILNLIVMEDAGRDTLLTACLDDVVSL